MQSQASIEIDRPIEEVFEFTTTRVVEWSTIVVEDEVVDEGDEGVGTRFCVVTEERGRRMAFEGVVTHHQPPQMHAVSLVGRQFDMRVEYRFEDLDGRTRVTQASTVQGKGWARLMLALFGRFMAKAGCDAARKELNNLKRLMEAQAPAASPPRP